jgi:hypothetical protein
MARRTRPVSTPHPAGEHVGEDSRAEQSSPEHGELRITQDVNPSGLGLIPSGMARRIAEAVSRGRSSHA